MQTNTILYIVLAAILSLVVVYFQYYFKSKQKGSLRIMLSILRFVGIFGLLVLLINPKFSKLTYTLEKPSLVLLVDNSTSMYGSKEKVKELLVAFRNNTELSDRFEIASYQFGKRLRPFDSLTFTDVQTDIQKPLSTLKDVYARRNTAMVLVSDGNQNIGRDYSFSEKVNSPAIYTITVGDTTRYEDLSIGPINTNKYAFLNNKYPLETYVSYQGQGTIEAKVQIKIDGTSIFNKTVRLSRTNNIGSINTLIKASKVGVKSIQVTVDKLSTERNTSNNSRTTSVEVINEKTTIALVAGISHPDIGALKKAIESNEQREVVIVKPSASAEVFDEADIFILYQPNTLFRKIFERIEQKQSNFLIITGLHTDYNFLNSVQQDFQIENGYPEQEFFGTLNTGFSKFDIMDLDLVDFPPLASDSGPLSFNQSNEVLLGVTIKGLDMKTPLLSVYGENERKKALFLGEGIWKWRVQSFRNLGEFSNIDAFLGKLIRYLSANSTKNRLNVTYSRNYEGSNTAYISATFFDETYVFNPNATINVAITNGGTKRVNNMPMVLKNGYFEADMTNLLPGAYTFSVKVEGENYAETGAFVISDFDLEKQFVSSNYGKMEQLAVNTGGSHYFPSQYKEMAGELISSNAYVPIQKSTENVVSLIDFKMLLALIVFAFAAEWFIRKFNGLI